MPRAVYIGGFGNGKASSERVAEALGDYYQDVDPFTFSCAMENREVVRRAMLKADVITHSAGFLAVVGNQANRINAFNAPLPTTRRHLVAKTLNKTARMHTPAMGIKHSADIGSVLRYDASALAELAAHPKANLGRLGVIASFDAVKQAIQAAQANIPTSLVYTENDSYYRMDDDQAWLANSGGVEVYVLPGEHDEVVLRPAQTIGQFFVEFTERNK